MSLCSKSPLSAAGVARFAAEIEQHLRDSLGKTQPQILMFGREISDPTDRMTIDLEVSLAMAGHGVDWWPLDGQAVVGPYLTALLDPRGGCPTPKELVMLDAEGRTVRKLELEKDPLGRSGRLIAGAS